MGRGECSGKNRWRERLSAPRRALQSTRAQRGERQLQPQSTRRAPRTSTPSRAAAQRSSHSSGGAGQCHSAQRQHLQRGIGRTAQPQHQKGSSRRSRGRQRHSSEGRGGAILWERGRMGGDLAARLRPLQLRRGRERSSSSGGSRAVKPRPPVGACARRQPDGRTRAGALEWRRRWRRTTASFSSR